MNDKGHFYISLIKSITRITSGITTVFTGVMYFMVIGFVVAELFGIIEELLDKRWKLR